MNRVNRFRVMPLLAAALTCGLVSGCGDGRPNRVRVSGRVYLDGEPLKLQGDIVVAGRRQSLDVPRMENGGIWAWVRIEPKDAREAKGEIQNDGTFTLEMFGDEDGCVIGEHPVSVIAFKQINAGQKLYLVPPDYRDPSKSGLTAKIDGPTDDLRIDLSWEGRGPFIEMSASGGDVDPAAIQ